MPEIHRQNFTRGLCLPKAWSGMRVAELQHFFINIYYAFGPIVACQMVECAKNENVSAGPLESGKK